MWQTPAFSMITDDDEDNGCPMETVTKENIKKKPANDLKDRKIRLIEIALSEISKEYVRYFVHEDVATRNWKLLSLTVTYHIQVPPEYFRLQIRTRIFQIYIRYVFHCSISHSFQHALWSEVLSNHIPNPVPHTLPLHSDGTFRWSIYSFWVITSGHNRAITWAMLPATPH